MTVEDDPGPERLQLNHDFSSLQGLQVVGDGPWTRNDRQEDALQREALVLELETRVARFHQAIDASIVLASDGVVRWLGDPVARLAPGGDLLTPSALILADIRLPDSARQAVEARIELWLGALTRKLLGPLFSLRNLQEGSESVRDLAGKVANALGVLERDAVRNQVKAFDQNSRAALRKHGVRFGAYYIYVPTVLKPASRTLALQLWGLKTPAANSEALTQALAPLASSGRTSLPFDESITRDGYRVAGFRPCGNRVVRVDIVERLADLIRATFNQPDTGSRDQAQTGFVVGSQMTSLTGCSGEAFASILRSLGFESFVIKRSEFRTAPTAVEAKSRGSAAAAPTSGESVDENFAEAETPTQATDEPSVDAADRLEAEVRGSVTVAEAAADKVEELVAVQDTHVQSESEPGSPSATGDSPRGAEVLVSDQTITLWRPVRRIRSPRVQYRQQRAKTESLPAPAPQLSAEGACAESPALCREHVLAKWGRRDRTASEQDVGTLVSPSVGRPESQRSDDKRRQSAGNREMPRPKASLGSQQPVAAIDPNSPFAKLLELRPLLEKQGKNRR
jgi:ATP-dependent RNA helicase SUPV3L1/SUV3